MISTIDNSIFIEEKTDSYIKYLSVDGKRWEVHGICDHRGDCIVGSVINGEFVSTIERAHELAMSYEGPDIPVGPGFSGCCALRIVEL